MLRLFSVCLVFYCIAINFIYFYLSSDNSVRSYVYTIIQNCVISAIVVPACIMIFHSIGISIGYSLSYFLIFAVIIISVCIKQKGSPFSTKTYLILPKNFSVDEDQIFSHTLKVSDDINKFETSLQNFCDNFNISNNSKKSLVKLCDYEIKTIIENALPQKLK